MGVTATLKVFKSILFQIVGDHSPCPPVPPVLTWFNMYGMAEKQGQRCIALPRYLDATLCIHAKSKSLISDRLHDALSRRTIGQIAQNSKETQLDVIVIDMVHFCFICLLKHISYNSKPQNQMCD